MPRAAAAFLVLAVLCFAGLLWMVVADEDDDPPRQDSARADDVRSPEGTPQPDDRGPRNPTPVTDDDLPLVPRVLPPDAALEDIRDALAADDAAGLQHAYSTIGRLAAQSAQSMSALTRQIRRTDDPAVRGVALVAASRSGSESALRFAATRLMTPKGRASADIVGALAALLLDRTHDSNADVALVQLGGLELPIGGAPDEDFVRKAIVFFLDHTPEAGDERDDVVALFERSIERSPVVAELLVDAGGKRAYAASLSDDHWSRLGRAARGHELSEAAAALFD